MSASTHTIQHITTVVAVFQHAGMPQNNTLPGVVAAVAFQHTGMPRHSTSAQAAAVYHHISTHDPGGRRHVTMHTHTQLTLQEGLCGSLGMHELQLVLGVA